MINFSADPSATRLAAHLAARLGAQLANHRRVLELVGQTVEPKGIESRQRTSLMRSQAVTCGDFSGSSWREPAPDGVVNHLLERLALPVHLVLNEASDVSVEGQRGTH